MLCANILQQHEANVLYFTWQYTTYEEEFMSAADEAMFEMALKYLRPEKTRNKGGCTPSLQTAQATVPLSGSDLPKHKPSRGKTSVVAASMRSVQRPSDGTRPGSLSETLSRIVRSK
jgi:hypothetical protein